MKKMTIVFATAMATAVSFGTSNDAEAVNRRLQISGGSIVMPAKGKIALLNAQKRISAERLQGRADLLEGILCAKMTIEPCEGFSIDKAGNLMAKANADIAFFVIDDPTLPMSLVALEGPWAMINIAKLAEGASDDKVLVRRMGAEFNRVVRSLLSVGESGAASHRKGEAKRAPRSGADLDGLDAIGISVQEAMVIHANMPTFGIREARKTTYLRACREGWAPAPTNEYQKAIWDKVHAMPTEPIKIKPETKKVRE